MKKLNYFALAIALMFTAIISVYALDASEINVENNKASFSKTYSKLEEAKSAITDFETYVKNNKGVVLSTKTDVIINEINNEILSGVIEADDLSVMESSANLLDKQYADMSTDNVKYSVVYGDIETIEEEVVDYEYEEGEIGAYDNIVTAYLVSRMMEAYNNRDDYEFRTRIAIERRIVNTLVEHLDRSFSSNRDRRLYLFGYSLAGYDLSSVELSEETITDVTYETKEFNTLDERDAYIDTLEGEGFRVSQELNSIHFDEVEEDVNDINEDFDSIESLNDYIRNIDQNYNHKDVNITDNSYTETTDEVVSQEGFETEDDAQVFIDGYKNDYHVSNEKITSYEANGTESENITKFFTSENDANNALNQINNSLNNGETITSSSVRRLSLDEIDMEEVFNNGDTNLSSANVTYNNFGISSTTTSMFNYLTVYTTRGTRSGRARITSVTVDGVRLNAGMGNTFRMQNGVINNNSKVVVTGEIIYGNNRVNFTAQGILNNTNDNSRDRNTFEYIIQNATIDRDGSVNIGDNLVDIYRLDVTKEIPVNKTLYKAEANIYRVRRIESYNLSGTVSNIRQVPVYVVDITKEKDRLVYNVLGDATRDVYGIVYAVYYNATRTIRDILTSYRQEFTVIETVKETSYLAEGTANLNVEKAPNTGLDIDNNNNYMYLLLSIIPLGYLMMRRKAE